MRNKKTGRFVKSGEKTEKRQLRSSNLLHTSNDLNEYEEKTDYNFFSRIGRDAAANAINENRAMKLPVTYMKNGWVVRDMPEGGQIRIAEIQVKADVVARIRKLTKGTILHVRKKH